MVEATQSGESAMRDTPDEQVAVHGDLSSNVTDEPLGASEAPRKTEKPKRHRLKKVAGASGWLVGKLYGLCLLLAILGISFFVGGFIRFGEAVSTAIPADVDGTQAVVVLTGGADRIKVAVDLMEKNKGERLLISGVNTKTTPAAIKKANQFDEVKLAKLFDCCVDIGHAALDTKGNAVETAEWVMQHGYSRIIVVTSNYHMPRALLELRQQLPDAEISGHGVTSANIDPENWLTDSKTLKVYLSEYGKYVAAQFARP